MSPLSCFQKHCLYVTSSILVLLVCTVFAEEFVCNAPGKFPHSGDGTKYHECYLVGGMKYTHIEHSCPPDNCFASSSKSCMFTGGNCGTSEDATTSSNSTNFVCPHSGKFAHPDQSRKGSFIRCVEADNQLYAYEYQCLPTKPCYSETKMRCVQPSFNSSLVVQC